jgi:hypothetical protein
MLAHVRHNAIAYAALFVALGGTSYAAARLPAGSVGSKELHSGAVTKTKLHRGAVTSASVQDHTLKAVDFARGQLAAGPKGDKGDAGAKGDKGDPGPTLGVAGADTGSPKTGAIAATSTVTATKTVTLTTRSRLFVLASVWADTGSCGTLSCYATWGVLVDGVPVPHGARAIPLYSGESWEGELTPFGVTGPLEPGTHTVALAKATYGAVSVGNGDQDVGAIALGV